MSVEDRPPGGLVVGVERWYIAPCWTVKSPSTNRQPQYEQTPTRKGLPPMAVKVKKPLALSEAMTRARTLRTSLDNATDKLNASIAEVEQALASMKLGVRVQLDLTEPNEHPHYTHLIFGKHNGTWRLFMETGTEEIEDTYVIDSREPLVNVSRELRLYAVANLPNLVAKFSDTIESEIERVQAANVTADIVAAEIRMAQEGK